MRRAQIILIAAAVMLAACGSPGAPSGVAAQTPTTTTVDVEPTTATARPPSTAPPAAAEEDPVGYLVEISNLVAARGERLSDFEEGYNAEHQQPTTDEEWLSYFSGYWNGSIDLILAHAAEIESIVPPPGFEKAHSDYASAYRTLFEDARRRISDYTTLADWLAFIQPEFDEGNAAYVAACLGLEQTTAAAGYELDMQCPEPPPEAIELRVEVGGTWMATPAQLPTGADLVAIEITNTGSEPVRVVVLDIFEGDPTSIPVAEGLVDITLSGVTDPSSGYAAFGLAYPDGLLGDDSRVQGEPPELSPGKSITVQLWISGDLVIFDYRDGEYEAGSYVVIERP